jgi:PAS domain S-box-containing protein
MDETAVEFDETLAPRPLLMRPLMLGLAAAFFLCCSTATIGLGVVVLHSYTYWSDATVYLVSAGTVAAAWIPLVVGVARRYNRSARQFERSRRIQRVLTDEGGDLLGLLDNAGRPLWVAASFTRRLGWTREELMAAPWSSRVHPNDLARCRSVRERCVKEHVTGFIAFRTLSKSGEYVWVETGMFPLVAPDGSPDGFIVRQRDISNAVALRDELSEHSERVSLAQLAAGIGLWEYLLVENVLHVPEGTRQLFGLSADVPLDLPTLRGWLELGSDSPPVGGSRVMRNSEVEAAFRATIDRGADLAISVRVRFPTGQEREFALTATAVRSPRGHVQRIVGTVRDVTGENQRRASLMRSESTVNAVIEHAPVALAICDSSLRCIRVSRHWTKLFPTTGEGEIGRLVVELLPGDPSLWTRHCASALGGAARRHSDERLIDAAGHERWLRWEILPWSDANGGIGGIMVIAEDVTARKEEERRMTPPNDLSALVGTWVYDVESGAVNGSDGSHRLLGSSAASFGSSYAAVQRLFIPTSAARLDAAGRRAISERRPFDIELEIRAPAEGVRYVRTSGRPELSKDGTKVERLVGTVRDVTAESERTDELRGARAEAERLNRAKSEFLASMSHEIRTPMTAILGYAELLSTDAWTRGDPNRVRESAETIQRNARRLLAIINDILDLSQIEAGKMVLEYVPTSPMGVLAEVLHLLGPIATAKGLELTSQGGLPARRLVLIDPIRLGQILTNLVGNAIKFTERGRVAVEVELGHVASDGPAAGSRPGGNLVFRVSDTGIGMSPEQLSRVFLSFEQADSSTRRRYGGTGLGLPISHRLAALMGGSLIARSRLGEGTTITLTLPVGVLPDAGPSSEARLARGSKRGEAEEQDPLAKGLAGGPSDRLADRLAD